MLVHFFFFLFLSFSYLVEPGLCLIEGGRSRHRLLVWRQAVGNGTKHTILKVTGHSKIYFCRVFPHWAWAQDFFATCTFRRTSFQSFRFTQFVPFCIKNSQNLSEICKKGTNCEILNLKYRRLGSLKVHVKYPKKSLVLMRGNPSKIKLLSDQSRVKNIFPVVVQKDKCLTNQMNNRQSINTRNNASKI